MDRQEQVKENNNDRRLIFGAIGGAALAFIIEMVSGTDPSQLHPLLKIALGCCSLLVPISIIGFQISALETRFHLPVKHPPFIIPILGFTVFVSYFTILITLWYISFIYGLIFIVFLGFGFLYYLNVFAQLERSKQGAKDNAPSS